MRVMAKELGFYGGARRRPGEVFSIPDGEQPSKWMEIVEQKSERGSKGKAHKARPGEPEASETTVE